MISIRVQGSGSWLDPESARKLSGELADRLWRRCQGHRGLFLTLTYRHDDYPSALELYRRQSEEQHVPMFFRRLRRILGESFTGRWFSKLEFQRGGWVHWHIILLDVPRIEHRLVAEAWGHGFVWIKRLSERNVRYCTKYTTKPGGIPAWLLLEKPRSVKIVRVSPGFWGNPPSASEVADPPEPRFRIGGIWRPVGARIAECRSTVIARDGDQTNYRRARIDLSQLLVSLFGMGYAVVGADRGWLIIDAPSVRVFDRAVSQVGGVHVGGAGREAAAPPLHLIGTSNPDSIVALLDDLCREAAVEVAA